MNLIITQELFEAFKSGDQQVGDLICNLTYDRLNNYVRKGVKNENDAREVFQEIWCDFLTQRKNIRSRETLMGYLFTIARYKIKEYFHKKGKHSTCNFEDISDPDGLCAGIMPDPERRYISMENELLLHKTISQMPEQKRKIFWLYRFEGMSISEISQKLDISERTVENHIYRTTKQLKIIFLSLVILICTHLLY